MYVTPLNIDPDKPALPISHPFIYSVYLSKLLGRFITLGEANDTWALNEGALDEKAFLELTYSNHAEWEAMLANALAKTPRGLVAIVFETTDSIQHMFFRYLDKAHPALKAAPAADERRGHRGPLPEDGRPRRPKVAAGLGEKGVLFVMSDHGFKSFRRGVNLNSWLRQNGYLTLAEGRTGERRVVQGRRLGRGPGLTASASAASTSTSRAARRAAPSAPGAEAAALKAELGPQARRAQGRRRTARRRSPTSTTATPSTPGPTRTTPRTSSSATTRATGPPGTASPASSTTSSSRTTPRPGAATTASTRPSSPGSSSRTSGSRTDDPSIMDIAPTVLELFGLVPPAHMDGRGLVDAGRPLRGRRREGQHERRQARLSHAAGNSSRPASPPRPRWASAGPPGSRPRSTAGPGRRRR
ncbi:MAG: alkaline phosphatase family protein [Candidatus Moduliflexus flocculans]|nr:alkaline phosphatase family protein [Candidatus Moduliflexus flocculans]